MGSRADPVAQCRGTRTGNGRPRLKPRVPIMRNGRLAAEERVRAGSDLGCDHRGCPDVAPVVRALRAQLLGGPNTATSLRVTADEMNAALENAGSLGYAPRSGLHTGAGLLDQPSRACRRACAATRGPCGEPAPQSRTPSRRRKPCCSTSSRRATLAGQWREIGLRALTGLTSTEAIQV